MIHDTKSYIPSIPSSSLEKNKNPKFILFYSYMSQLQILRIGALLNWDEKNLGNHIFNPFAFSFFSSFFYACSLVPSSWWNYYIIFCFSGLILLLLQEEQRGKRKRLCSACSERISLFSRIKEQIAVIWLLFPKPLFIGIIHLFFILLGVLNLYSL